MYSIQQQCNTTIYLHPDSLGKSPSLPKLNKFKSSKRRLSQSFSSLLILQWFIILFLGYGNCSVNEISGGLSRYTGVMSISSRAQQALPNSRGVFIPGNMIEFFEDGEELEEDQRRINTVFLTIISIYRIVPYIVKPKKYFQNLNWKCLSPHLPYYVRYCSLKIPSKFMFN